MWKMCGFNWEKRACALHKLISLPVWVVWDCHEWRLCEWYCSYLIVVDLLNPDNCQHTSREGPDQMGKLLLKFAIYCPNESNSKSLIKRSYLIHSIPHGVSCSMQVVGRSVSRTWIVSCWISIDQKIKTIVAIA